MKRMTNHATDQRKYGESELDIDPDLNTKASAYVSIHKRSYAGNVRSRQGGYRTRRIIKSSSWQQLAMNQEHHRQLTERAEKQERKKASKNKARRNKRRGKKW
tara:strand:+ start:1432 stop:1740 length:309 start_codon:yes stop_codon:yes gene_type:complete